MEILQKQGYLVYEEDTKLTNLSQLWISYFEEGGTLPPPFNIIPTPKEPAMYVGKLGTVGCPQ